MRLVCLGESVAQRRAAVEDGAQVVVARAFVAEALSARLDPDEIDGALAEDRHIVGDGTVQQGRQFGTPHPDVRPEEIDLGVVAHLTPRRCDLRHHCGYRRVAAKAAWFKGVLDE